MKSTLKKTLSVAVCCGATGFGFACAEEPSEGAAGMAGMLAAMTGGVGGAATGGIGGMATGGASGVGSGGVSGASSTGTGGTGTGGAAGSSTGGVGGTATGGSGGGSGGVSGAMSTGGSSGMMSDAGELEPFSFFVASFEAMIRLSGSDDGFGGDLRHGEDDGLTGADKICTEIAEFSMPGSGAKGWRAFLSAAEGPDGNRVDAIDRIGEGPWFDRLGRTVAEDKDALLNTRPEGADPMIVNDLPNEYGVPNHRPDPTMPMPDNHHVLTGSDDEGRLYGGNVNSTCDNWTALTNAGRPRIGFSWPAGGREHWISGQDEGGCGAGAVLFGMGGSDPTNPVVGSGGGYGGIYCFALMP